MIVNNCLSFEGKLSLCMLTKWISCICLRYLKTYNEILSLCGSFLRLKLLKVRHPVITEILYSKVYYYLLYVISSKTINYASFLQVSIYYLLSYNNFMIIVHTEEVSIHKQLDKFWVGLGGVASGDKSGNKNKICLCGWNWLDCKTLAQPKTGAKPNP